MHHRRLDGTLFDTGVLLLSASVESQGRAGESIDDGRHRNGKQVGPTSPQQDLWRKDGPEVHRNERLKTEGACSGKDKTANARQP
jgi:hypothetical protein